MPRPSLDDRLRSLLEEYGHVLRRAIHRVAPRGMNLDVEDIEQEARLRVWRAMQKETVFEQPASYLYRVAVNATLDAVERARARREQPLEAAPLERTREPMPSPARLAGRRRTLARVGEAMTRLQTNRRRAVGLHLQGFTTAEIGELCGWTEPKARNLAYRGLGDLRRLLEQEGESLDELEGL